jgi:hypothetical protein
MGLRYDQPLIDRVLSGVRQMEESVTSQAIVRRGLQDGLQQEAGSEARTLFLRLSRKKLGAPTPEHEHALKAMTDRGRLERLTDKVLDMNTEINC